MKVLIPGVRTGSATARVSNDQAVGERYTDLEITTVDKFISGDITISRSQEAIIGSVRNILLTGFGELVYDPGAGSNLTSLLFGEDSDDQSIRGDISSALQLEEPRVELLTVAIERDGDHTLYINITVNVKGDDTLQNVDMSYRIKRLST